MVVVPIGGNDNALDSADRYNPNKLLITDCYALAQSRIAPQPPRECGDPPTSTPAGFCVMRLCPCALLKQRSNIGTAMTASLASELGLQIRQPDTIAPAAGIDDNRMS